MATEGNSVEELFEAAMPLSSEDRVVLLDERCKGSPELRRTVERLLAASDQAGSFLERPLLAPSPQSTARASEVYAAVDSWSHEESGTLQAGQLLAGRFTIHRFVARGGMGEVWEAWDAEVGERVALKTIRPELARSPQAVQRFRREVKQARAISHPNVCRIHELFTVADSAGGASMFLCMEFLEGPTLSEYLRHHGPFEPDAAYRLVEQLVQGLNSAHALGIVHRDFKSQNVILVNSGPGRMRAVITDFGLALNVLAPDGHPLAGRGEGTPNYMAPEQRLAGKVTALADQYALGVVMCEMLTGSLPSRSLNASKNRDGLSLPGKALPPRWTQVLERCLATRPEARFPRLDDILRHIERPRRVRWPWAAAVAAVACLILLGVIVRIRRSGPPAAATSLAVLPLRNESGDSKLEYLRAGFTEALTNDLAGMPNLQVKAEEIAGRYSSQNADPIEFGKRLHVSSLVSGSFEDQDGHLRIPVEIIDVETGSQMWGKTYEGELANMGQLQNEISTDVAYHLKIRLDPDLTGRLSRQYATVPAAYDAYLKGRYSLGKRTPDDLQEAVVEFQRALAADPHYAPAYAGLADGYVLLAHYGAEEELPLMRRALSAADQALALDSTLGEAYVSRALARTLLSYEWKQAESDYIRGLELNPNYVNGHLWYALALLAPQGRDAEAQGQFSYVQAADPNSLLTHISAAMIAKCGGRDAVSADILEQHFVTDQHFETAVEQLAFDYLALKRAPQAINLLQTTAVEQGEERQRNLVLSIAYAQAGNAADAARWFKVATERQVEKNSFPYATAVYYNSMGNQAKAIDALESAYLTRDNDLLFVNVDPLLMSLHSAPRYKKLLEKMNLE